MATKNICTVPLLPEHGKNTNVIVEQDGQLKRVNIDYEFDKKADGITCDALGDSIFVNDSAKARPKNIRVFGKSTQVKTNGYQLFNHSLIATKTQGGATVTNNGDGTFTVSGSGKMTGEHSQYVYYTHAQTVAMFKPGKIKLKDVKTTTPRVYIHPQMNGGNLGTLSVSGNTEFEITQAMLDNETFRIVIGFYAATGNDIVTGTIKPLLYQDENAAFEIFTGGKAAPHPDYPQTVENIEDPTVYIRRKNILKNQYADVFTTSGVTFTKLDDGGVHIKGTPTAAIYYNIDFLLQRTPILHKGKKVTASLEMTKQIPGLRLLPGYFTKTAHVNSAYNMQVGVNETGIYTPEFTFTYPAEAVQYRTFIGLPQTVSEELDVIVYPMIRLADAKDSTFEVFEEQSVELSFTLQGIPVKSGGNLTDANGQQWICDEIDMDRGVHIKRVGKRVFDGSADEDWQTTKASGANVYYAAISDKRNNYVEKPNALLCSHFSTYNGMNYGMGEIGHITETYYHTGNRNVLLNFDNGAGGLENYKAWLSENPITIYYALETPIETPLTDAEIYAFKCLDMNYPNTTIMNSEETFMHLEYWADTLKFLTRKGGGFYTVDKLEITMPTSEWERSSDDTCWLQEVTVRGITADSQIDLQPTPAQMIAMLNNGTSMFAANDNGVVTVYAVGSKPTSDMTMQASKMEVVYA